MFDNSTSQVGILLLIVNGEIKRDDLFQALSVTYREQLLYVQSGKVLKVIVLLPEIAFVIEE